MAAVAAQYPQIPMAASSFELQKENALGDITPSQWLSVGAKIDVESDIASSRSQTPEPKRPGSSEDFCDTTVPDDRESLQTHKILDEPILSLSPEELYSAKVLVLDLLGWGVPPEYIIERGVSLELVCIVFSELKLRLPENIAADYAAVLNARRTQYQLF